MTIIKRNITFPSSTYRFNACVCVRINSLKNTEIRLFDEEQIDDHI